MLNFTITLAELTEALEGAPHHKSPGLDGILVEVYSHYSEDLLSPLALTEVEEVGSLPDSMQEIITVLPKPGKDKLLLDSYRSISLLNADVKLFARVLAKGYPK